MTTKKQDDPHEQIMASMEKPEMTISNGDDWLAKITDGMNWQDIPWPCATRILQRLTDPIADDVLFTAADRELTAIVNETFKAIVSEPELAVKVIDLIAMLTRSRNDNEPDDIEDRAAILDGLVDDVTLATIGNYERVNEKEAAQSHSGISMAIRLCGDGSAATATTQGEKEERR